MLQLTVLQGDIAKVKCDAVIHPTNASCSLAGLVGKYLIQQVINFLFTCLFVCCRTSLEGYRWSQTREGM